MYVRIQDTRMGDDCQTTSVYGIGLLKLEGSHVQVVVDPALGYELVVAATFDGASVAAKNPIFLTTRRQLLGTYHDAINRHVRDDHGSVADDFLGDRLHVLEHVAKVAVYHGLTHSAFDLAVLYVVAVLGYA